MPYLYASSLHRTKLSFLFQAKNNGIYKILISLSFLKILGLGVLAEIHPVLAESEDIFNQFEMYADIQIMYWYLW